MVAIPAQPVVVTHVLITQLTRDDSFFAAFPEFSSLRGMPVLDKGCQSCNKKRVTKLQTKAFLGIVRSLSGDKLAKLKARVGTDKFQFNAFNEATGAYEVTVI